MKVKDFIIGVRHMGVIVDDINASVELYKRLYDLDNDEIRFFPPPGSEASREAQFAFVPLGGMEFELIQPISEGFKEKISNPPAGINHVAFTVRDLEKAVACMAAKGVRLGHVTRDGILDMKRSKVAYFNPEDTGGILVEFVEPAE